MDIGHIQWMMKEALFTCEKENLDDTLLLPLVILHDVGYAKVDNKNPLRLEIRKAHMEAGAKIAQEILKRLNYPTNKTEKISYYVSVHDNWALGDYEVFRNDRILGTFGDLDLMWIVTPKGWLAYKKISNKTDQELFEYARDTKKRLGRNFATSTTEERYWMYYEERAKEIQGIQNL